MKKSVLVIGGGFAGIEASKELASMFAVTLVDFKEYFEFTPGVLRALLRPEYYRQISVSYRSISQSYGFSFMKGEVTCLDYNSAMVKTADQTISIDFDYCVMACGGEYFEPIKPHRVFEDLMNERAETVEEYQNELEDAKSILIQGGGPVAVELAAEIISAFPDKKVVLANQSNKILKVFPKLAQIYVQSVLQEKGVDIRLNTHGEDSNQYDLVFKCMGISYKLDFMRQNFGQLVNKDGRMNVNQFLQIVGNIFAAGDVADTQLSLSTTAFVAEREGALAAYNIKCLERRRPMLSAKLLPTFYCLSLGPNLGVTIIGNLIIPGRIQNFVKDFIKYMKLKSLTSRTVSTLWSSIHKGITFIGLYLK